MNLALRRKIRSLVGERGYHTTLSGKTRVYYPKAYGWPTRYHRSTIRIEIGAALIPSIIYDALEPAPIKDDVPF